jgi:hypothetical protein
MIQLRFFEKDDLIYCPYCNKGLALWAWMEEQDKPTKLRLGDQIVTFHCSCDHVFQVSITVFYAVKNDEPKGTKVL